MSAITDLCKNTAILAPLAGVTDLPFRLVAREFGCGLCFTEMVSANGLVRETAKTLDYLKTCPEDRPLGVQIFGADPAVMAEAARIVGEHDPDILDLNMGCPVRKVVKTGAGAMLMKDLPLAGRIIAAVVRAVKKPVTVKMRAGWSRATQNAVQLARIAEDAGAAAVIVHGRTADQGFSGFSDWSVIADVKRAVGIPVVGNGDIRKPSDALDMLKQTECDAVMVGRGALGNPWIFQGISELLAGASLGNRPRLAERYALIRRHWDLEVRHRGARLAGRSFRKHLLWYTKGLPSSGRLREAMGKMTDSDRMFAELEEYFRLLEQTQPEIMT